MIFLLSILPVVWHFTQTDKIFYRSPELYEVRLSPLSGQFSMKGDQGERVELKAMVDDRGALYWHRRVRTPVCLTEECKLVDVGLYWDLTGDFFGIDVYGEHL